MQGVLLAAVVVLAALVVLDLALSLAIVRRLREDRAARAQVAHPFLARLVGQPVPELVAVANDGSAVTAGRLREGSWFAAFVSVGCGACHDDLPRLREHVAARRAAGDPVLVVVSDEAGDGGELAATVAEDALVVVESAARPVSEAFGVEAYPTYLEVDGGAVVDAHLSMTEVPAPAAV